MSDVRYARLARLRVALDYFPQGAIPGLTLEPTPETARMLVRYALRLRAGTSETEIWAATTGGTTPVLHMPVDTVLAFWINADLPELGTISADIKPGSVFAAHSLGAEAQDDGALRCGVTRDLPFVPQSRLAALQVAPPVSGDTLALRRHALDRTVWQGPAPEDSFGRVALDPTCAQGAYTLRVDGEAAMQMVIGGRKGPIGLIEITPALTDTPPTERLIQNGASWVEQTYHIALQTRSVRTVYHIMGASDPRTRILQGGQPAPFLGPLPETVRGQAGLRFTSLSEVPLRAAPAASDVFVLTLPNPEREDRITLPMPSASGVVPGAKGQPWEAHLYVGH